MVVGRWGGRMACTEVDVAFSGCEGLGSRAGVWVWRMEGLRAVAQAPGTSTLCRGDSYVVVASRAVSGTGRETDAGEVESVIYTWVGGESTADERGCAAVKVTEVARHLGGGCPQVFESEGHESAGFLSLWRPCLEVVEGGVPSAFARVDRDAFEARLMQVKGSGRRGCVVRRVALSRASLNSGDTFLLDLGRRVVVWCGRESHRGERARALEVALGIRDGDRGGAAAVDVVEEGESGEVAAGPLAAFWGAMPEGEGPVASAAEGGRDDEEDDGCLARATLYRVSDAAGGEPRCEPVTPTTPGGGVPALLRRADLDGDDCFVLDCGSEIFVWVGRGATEAERAEAVAAANRFLGDAGRPEWTRVTRLVEGAETAFFKSKFQWPPAPLERKPAAAAAAAAAREVPEVDVGALVTSPRAERGDDARVEVAAAAVGDGEGEVTVWVAVAGGTEAVAAEEAGVFYSAESYVVQYTYPTGPPGGQKQVGHVVYFWLGRDAAAASKGTAALEVKARADALGPGVPQVRVAQNAEPPHFLRLFGGRMLVRLGGRGEPRWPSSVAAAAGGKRKKKKGKKGGGGGVGAAPCRCELYHVKGGNGAIRAVQVVECVASALNSSDCFLAVPEEAEGRVTVWHGRGASRREREVAVALAGRLGSSACEEVEEGSEGDAFWEWLGGRAPYPEGRPEDAEGGTGVGAGPRLFCCSDAGGSFAVEEVPSPWGQEDLSGDDVMLLDGGAEVYVWVGSGANEVERAAAMATAEKYLEAVAKVDGRSGDAPVTVVAQGAEPPAFTAYFVGWNPEYVDPMAAYAARLEALTQGRLGAPDQNDNVKDEMEEEEEDGSGGGGGDAPEYVGGIRPARDALSLGAESLLRAQRESLRRTPQRAPAKPPASEMAVKLAERLARMAQENEEEDGKEDGSEGASAAGFAAASAAAAAAPGPFVRQTYPYEVLKVTSPGQALPPGVRAEERELSLSDAEFAAVMGMPREGFTALPLWKRKALKQKAMLF